MQGDLCIFLYFHLKTTQETTEETEAQKSWGTYIGHGRVIMEAQINPKFNVRPPCSLSNENCSKVGSRICPGLC